MNWDDFYPLSDMEMQPLLVTTDLEGVDHVVDWDTASHLIDSVNGHRAPTAFSERFVDA